MTQTEIDSANPRDQSEQGESEHDHLYTVADGPLNMLSNGQRWLSTHINKNGKGGVRQVMSGGTVAKPFQSAIWSKATCERSGPFCQSTTNGVDYAFTQFPAGMDDVTESLWFVSIYQPGDAGNELLGIIHEEKVGDKKGTQLNGEVWALEGKTRLGLAWSTDYGNTWRYLGRIVVPSADRKHKKYNITGAPYIIRGDYMYLYYVDSIEDTGSHVMGVSRAPINEVINAARAGSIFGLDNTGQRSVPLWHKYYDPQNSLEPQMSEVEFNSHFITPSHQLPAYASQGLLHWSGVIHTQSMYSAKTDKYYIPLAHMSWDGPEEVVLYSSSDGVRWDTFKTLQTSSKYSQGQFAGGSIYCSLHDVNGAPNHRTWDSFYVTCTRASGGKVVEEVANEPKKSVDPKYHGLWRWKIDLSGSTTVYSQSSNFSNNQSGPWTYHYGFGVGTPSEQLYHFTAYSNGVWGSAARAAARISATEMHPGTNEDVILKWTAPLALSNNTQIRLAGVLRDADPGDGAAGSCAQDISTTVVGYDYYGDQDGVFGKVIHRHNGQDSLKFYDYVENGDTVGKSVPEANATFTVNPGDEILFIVDAGANNNCDTTAWIPSVEVF